MAVMGIKAKNPEQEEVIRNIIDKNKKIIFIKGSAGTGKTLITLASVLEWTKTDRKQILYTRDLIQVGEQMGFLPGSVEEKTDPFMDCLMDTIDSIERIGGQDYAQNIAARIDSQPICYMRGRSLHDTVLIVDEAQNLNLNSLKTVLTRCDSSCKTILMGDPLQMDRGSINNCAFTKVIEILKKEEFVAFVELKQSLRTDYCARIDELLSQIK